MWNITVWKNMLLGAVGMVVIAVVLSHVLPIGGCNNGFSIIHMGASK